MPDPAIGSLKIALASDSAISESIVVDHEVQIRMEMMDYKQMPRVKRMMEKGSRFKKAIGTFLTTK